MCALPGTIFPVVFLIFLGLMQVPKNMFRQLFFVSLLLSAGSVAARNNPDSVHHKDGEKGGNGPAPPVLDKKFLTLNGAST